MWVKLSVDLGKQYSPCSFGASQLSRKQLHILRVWSEGKPKRRVRERHIQTSAHQEPSVFCKESCKLLFCESVI